MMSAETAGTKMGSKPYFTLLWHMFVLCVRKRRFLDSYFMSWLVRKWRITFCGITMNCSWHKCVHAWVYQRRQPLLHTYLRPWNILLKKKKKLFNIFFLNSMFSVFFYFFIILIIIITMALLFVRFRSCVYYFKLNK